MVGFSTFTSDIQEVNKLLNLIRLYNDTSIKVLIGWPHPTSVKGDIFRDIPLADYAFHGEAEAGFEDFLVQVTQGRLV